MTAGVRCFRRSVVASFCLSLIAAPAAFAADSLVDIVKDVPRATARSAETAKPSPDAVAAFDAAFALLLNDSAGADKAPPAGYRLAAIEQDGRRARALLPTRSGFAPIVVIVDNPERDAILEAPHPVKDRATAEQTALFLIRLGARAAIISAHDRCAATTDSPCSGRTGICGGGNRAYPDSDPAHNDALLFHRAHRRLAALWPQSVVVQLHGFGGPSESLFVISDGSTEKRAGDRALPGRVRDRIRSALDDKVAALDCQDPGDRDIRAPRLCATNTVQGRALNGSSDVCRRNARSASGRFLHIEQDWRVRLPVRQDWRDALNDPRLRAVYDALAAELPCIAASCRR